MSKIFHEESAKIVNQAITALGQGKKGLADRLSKDPSLISRYASGTVRPKAEILIQCLDFIRESSDPLSTFTSSEESKHTLDVVVKAVSKLSPDKDKDIIEALFKMLQVAQKI